MDNQKIRSLLEQMGYFQTPVSITQFVNEEDGEPYQAWLIQMQDKACVLKEAKGFELDTYRRFFRNPTTYVPQLLGTAHADGADFLLMEYISGENLRHCDRERLVKVLDSLITMQREHWGQAASDSGYHYAHTLTGRYNRGKYLQDSQLEAAYAAFLQEYQLLPKSLCHDDLLPFNVIQSGDRTVFIDWECGGILPYPVSLARFIAHGEEDPDAFFYMKEEDKVFAIEYYYQNLIAGKGIAYSEYLHSMALFLFYEYCEWIYVGNKYNDTSMPRFRSYFQKAKALASKLGYKGDTNVV